jgi:hypothetical protein
MEKPVTKLLINELTGKVISVHKMEEQISVQDAQSIVVLTKEDIEKITAN